jgi:hypothetical protein
MNDSTELQYFFETLDAAIKKNPILPEAIPNLPHSQQQVDLADGYDARFAYAVKSYIRELPFCGAACLSQEPDALSMWRAYTPPGRGIRIEFETAKLMELADDQDSRLIACDYSLASLQRTIQKWQMQVPHWIYSETAEIAAQFYFTHLLWDATNYKHSSFEEEKEVRLVRQLPYSHANDNSLPRNSKEYQMEFRAGKHSLVPFQRFSIRKSANEMSAYTGKENWKWAISSIMIGPSREPQLAQDSILAATNSFGLYLAQDDVKRSSIPFRDI